MGMCTPSCLTLCDPMDCGLPGSSVHGISQARILVWVAVSFSKGSSWPRDWTHISCVSGIAGGFFATWAMWLISISAEAVCMPEGLCMSCVIWGWLLGLSEACGSSFVKHPEILVVRTKWENECEICTLKSAIYARGWHHNGHYFRVAVTQRRYHGRDMLDWTKKSHEQSRTILNFSSSWFKWAQ